MANTSGCNRVLFSNQSVGLSSSGSNSLILSHNLGETPHVQILRTALLGSPGIIAVTSRNASQIGLTLNDASGTAPQTGIDVVADRVWTPCQ